MSNSNSCVRPDSLSHWERVRVREALRSARFNISTPSSQPFSQRGKGFGRMLEEF